MIREQIEAYFADKEPLLVEAVSRLVSIDSVEGEPAPGAPFGPGPAAALEEALAIAGEWGLSAQNHEGYVGTADLNDGEDALHILGHLDVVAPGEGWTVTKPYAPKLVDGLLYGRGTDDDKGPVIASLLAMKAVKDLGVPLKKRVRRHCLVLCPPPLRPGHLLPRLRLPCDQYGEGGLPPCLYQELGGSGSAAQGEVAPRRNPAEHSAGRRLRRGGGADHARYTAPRQEHYRPHRRQVYVRP